MEGKYNLEPTAVSWIKRDPEFGDFILKSDLFAIRGHEGFGLVTNSDSHVSYKTFPKVNAKGEIEQDEGGNEVMTGEYFLTLYLEHEMDVPVTDENGNVVRDDLGRVVTRKGRKAEIIATDLRPDDAGRETRVANRFARKMASVRKYRAKDPRTVKRGRKAKNASGETLNVKPFQVELCDSMWHVVKLGQTEPVARFPGTVDGRNEARKRAAEENSAETGE